MDDRSRSPRLWTRNRRVAAFEVRTWRFGFAALLLLSACGSSPSNSAGGAASSGSAATATAPAGPAPSDLVGRYQMTLTKTDLPSKPPPELGEALGRWTLDIENTGGPTGHSFTVRAPGSLGVLEAPGFAVDGDRIHLIQEECAAEGTTVESDYEWHIEGDALMFGVVRNGCPDDVLLTVLTSHPWQRTS